jgi:rhodanese-related sulfurtransferase
MQACDDGALVVDVRTELQFDEAHVPGAVSITALRAGFGSKLAWLVEPDPLVVLVGRDDEDARQAATLAAAVGITRIAGFLAGGMTSWREDRRPVERVERISVPELHDRRDKLQILDVRELAASLLRRHGVHEALHVVDGGVPLWRREGWPIEEPEGAPSGS